MPKKNVEVYLKALGVNNNGVLEEGVRGNHILSAELLYPSTGRPTVLYQKKKLELLDNEVIDFETLRDEKTGELKYDEFGRLMFKEEILNKAKLDVLLTHTEDVKEFDIFLTKVFSSIISIGGGLLPGIVSAIAGGVTGAAEDIKNEELRKKGQKPNETIYTIGKASLVLDLESDELKTLTPGQSKEITIKLNVPKTITKEVFKSYPPDVSPKPKRVPEVVIAKTEVDGKNNAFLKIIVKVVE